MKKSGGLWFWKLGRVGGSFYISKRKKPRHRLAPVTDLVLAALIGFPTGWFLTTWMFS